ncbi:uncharacterized protein LOC107463608 isoform X1 [Arachis duranensis]|uniref:Uncharacterized protein LOC107463608 isoform X1 n=1 Tax=Arachis duranensis TaxID=130453 RepID=A0A6P4BDM1_ARADU|nr:uncharacterized protein LOC107463608 isoform X1 [Arachis duranensis]
MMAAAAAEVRAAWQRTANRCFVQEDAKRAPKLACCQPCCTASKPVDAGAANAADESNHAVVSATSFNNKSSLSSLTPDSRWWLHPQPSYGSRKGLTYEELISLQDDIEILKASDETKAFKRNDATQFSDKNDFVDCSMSLESDFSWIEVGKSWPWWRTSDRDELASFVSQKSVNHIENCDLPPPQKYLSGQPCGSADSTARSKGSLPALSCDTRHVYLASNKSSSIYSSIHEDVMDQVLEGNHSKTELIEALCHSQTRARMAEEAAKQAYAEKEHIITLFFKQASQLFAYKQWFQLLLVENLHIQLKNNKDQQISGLFQAPASFERGAKPWKTRHKPKGDITTTYAVAFALGLSLVGAGLILGWSVGWMLPRL